VEALIDGNEFPPAIAGNLQWLVERIGQITRPRSGERRPRAGFGEKCVLGMKIE
jgi:hypothetical protein